MDFSFDEYIKAGKDERDRRWPHTKLLLNQDGDGGERLWVRIVDTKNHIAMLDNSPLDRRWWYGDLVHFSGNRITELVKRTWDSRLGVMYHSARNEEQDRALRQEIYDRVVAFGAAHADVSFFSPGVGFVLVRSNTERSVTTLEVAHAIGLVEAVFDVSDITRFKEDGKFDVVRLFRGLPPVNAVLGEHEMQGEKVQLIALRYPNNRLAVQAVDARKEPYAKLSVNVPEIPLERCEFIVSHELDDEDIAGLIGTGIFADTGRRCDYGHVRGARILAVT